MGLFSGEVEVLEGKKIPREGEGTGQYSAAVQIYSKFGGKRNTIKNSFQNKCLCTVFFRRHAYADDDCSYDLQAGCQEPEEDRSLH